MGGELPSPPLLHLGYLAHLLGLAQISSAVAVAVASMASVPYFNSQLPL